MLSTFWVTNRCNMHCKYCYEGTMKSQKSMSIETANSAVEYVLNHFKILNDGLLIINFHGGEPLLEFDLIRHITEKFKDEFRNNNKQVMFGITTNGVLINEEIESYLCDNFKYSLSVSIDGEKLTHDKNRILKGGQGTYDIVIDKFINLLLKRPDIRARMTFNSSTVFNLFKNVKHLLGLGFNTIAPSPDYFDEKWDEHHMKILFDQLMKIQNIFNEEKKKNDKILIGMIDSIDFKNKGKCSGGTTTIHIDPEGYLYPCTYTVGDENSRLGHINTGIIKDRIIEINKLSEVENEACKGCSHYDSCSGTRCKIINKAMTGNYHMPSAVLCSVENVKYKILKHVKKN